MMLRTNLLQTVIGSGVVKVEYDKPYGLLLHINGADAKNVDGMIELIEHNAGTIAKVSVNDLKLINSIVYGSPVIDDPSDIVVFLPLVEHLQGYRAPISGELRIDMPTGYKTSVSMVEGRFPSNPLYFDALIEHVGVGRNIVTAGIRGKQVQMIVIPDVSKLSNVTLRRQNQIITEGSGAVLRGINTIFFTPETPTTAGIVISWDNKADDLSLEINAIEEHDVRLIIVSRRIQVIHPTGSLKTNMTKIATDIR